MNVAIYLRKSREDIELEKTLGEGETLKKHRVALLKYAKDHNLNIIEIKEEVVSGDSLFCRPQMLDLLKEVEENKYDGVLVMDIDRLGRGGMKDQGIILEAFKESNTSIITPGKTYDLNNEYDEEMTEFKTFFARRELKSITKRMQGGRIRSVERGNYIGTRPPLGYDIEFINKDRTLKINTSEAEIIKIIFNMYEEGNGASSIANHLNSLNLKTKDNNDFSQSSILNIIRNPIYIGKVTWNKKKSKKSKVPGKRREVKLLAKEDWTISEGKHEPIISEDQFNRCQDVLNGRYHIPYQLKNKPVNPFAGLITCRICGKKMTMRSLRGIPRLMCVNKCGNVSSRFDIVEEDVLKALEDYLINYKYEIENLQAKVNTSLLEDHLASTEKELITLMEQKNKLFDFLERGIYDEQTFIDRTKNLDQRIKEYKNTISKINTEIKKSNKKNNKLNIIKFENAINAYRVTDDVALKNKLLKSILYKIDYYKEKNSDYEIAIFPKVEG